MNPTNYSVSDPNYQMNYPGQYLYETLMSPNFNDSIKTITRVIEKYDKNNEYIGKEVITETIEYKTPAYTYQDPTCVDLFGDLSKGPGSETIK